MTPAITVRDFVRTGGDDGTIKALPYGLYPEITLYARNSNWFGKIDILSIGSVDITIEDIKTGKAKDADREQLLIYAWLWWRDDKRNPNSRLPTHLRIRYLDSSLEVPVLNESELVKFERDLADRTARAVATIAGELREARPDVEICRFCGVRQLCDVYWSDVVTDGSAGVGRHGDVEAELVRVLSRKTWQIEVGAGSSFAPSTKALLRGPLPENLAGNGSTLRILNAMFVEPTGDQPPDEMPVVQLLAQSELFVRPLSAEGDRPRPAG
ncbi:MAG: PD-(D/E)XK nuclease family protein [Gammaproteobacteria bacterium]